MNTLYDLSINQIVDLICAVGQERTVFVSGPMGSGKSSMLKLIGERFPDHHLCYFDATTKSDPGDLSLPNFAEGMTHVTMVPHEEFGLHTGKPVVIMIDEFGKGNNSVRQALTRVCLERVVGNTKLPEGSIVLVTSNLSEENVGDELLDHQNNRVIHATMRKPTNVEWVENFAVPNNLDPLIIKFVYDNPQLMQDFRDVPNPDDNPYIHHPRRESSSPAFVTPRSLHAASDIVKLRDKMDAHTLQAALIGTIGQHAANDMAAFIDMADQIPSLDEIKSNPETATVPTSPAAMCMVVYRTLQTLEPDWISNWMKYLVRLDVEAQSIFANMARDKDYRLQEKVVTNKDFSKWALENNYLYSADVK
jgi:hypothetical protein